MSLLPIRIPPAILALLLQFAAFILALLAVRLSGLQPTPLAFALFCGALAAILSRIAGLAFWWLLIQFAFAPALVLMLALSIPPAFFLVAFLVLLAVYWSTFRTKYRSIFPATRYGRRWSRLPADQPFSLIDLGSGIGGVLTYLVQNRPQGRYHGIESAPLPFLRSWLRIRFGGYRNCSVHWGSLWEAVVELDPLADAIRTSAKNHDLVPI